MSDEEQRLYSDWRLADSKITAVKFGTKSAARYGARKALRLAVTPATSNWYMDATSSWVHAALDGGFALIEEDDTYEKVLKDLNSDIEWISQTSKWALHNIDSSTIRQDLINKFVLARDRLDEAGCFPAPTFLDEAGASIREQDA